MFSLKLPEGYPDWQASDKGQRAQKLKHDNNSKDEDIGLSVDNINKILIVWRLS